MQAYDLYLRGRHLDALTDDKKSGKLAVQMLEEAVGLDSTFALAYAALSIAHGRMYWFTYDETVERLSKARAAADKALELQPDLPDAHLALALYYYWGYRDYDRALLTLKAGQRTRPNFGSGWIGVIQRRQGLWQESIASMEEEFRLIRNADLVVDDLVDTHIHMRNYKEAQTWLDLVPDHLYTKYQRLTIVLAWSGDTNKAWSIIESLPEELRKDFWSIRVSIIERKYEQALHEIASISAFPYEYQEQYEQKHLSFARTYWLLNNQLLSRTYADSSRMTLAAELSKRPGVARLHSALGLSYAFLGRTKEAIKEGKRALELMPVSKDALDGPSYVHYLAQIYAIIGAQDLAIEKLEYLLSIPSPLSVTWLKIDPTWDGLRNYPRFQKLLEKYSGSGS